MQYSSTHAPKDDQQKDTHDAHNEEAQEIQPEAETFSLGEEGGFSTTMPSEAEQLQAQVSELKDQLYRAVAEVENTKRLMQRRVEETSDFAVIEFARNLLSVLDNLNRAIETTPKDQLETPLVKSMFEGVEMTQKELVKVFDKYGIKPVGALGEVFDPHKHQVVVQIDSNDYEPGSIAHVVQGGYVMKDRVLRPAMVGVAKKPLAEPSETNGEA